MTFLLAQQRRTALLSGALVLIILKLWLVAAQPVVAHGNAGYDDRLFLELAGHVVDGDWLGPYSQFTLMKGPMYSFFIAGNFLLGLPLPLAQHLLYLFGCALLVLALRPCFTASWQAFAFFAVLWWQPMSYVILDVVRQSLYTPLTLMLFAGLCALETQRSGSMRTRLAWGVLLGISAAAFYLTREEGIWVVPGTVLLIGAAAWNSWRAGERLRPLVVPILAAAICATGILGTVCALNYHYYGWFGTVEFRAPEFLSAYGALQRPVPSKEIPYVPVTREVRLKLYNVSPAFAELKFWLEGIIGLEWATYSEYLTGRPVEDREMSGGRFMWALRDAVVESGHGRNAREALDFYKRLALEVNGACDEGLLGPTRRRRDTMIPPWRPENTQRLRDTAFDYVKYFFLFREFTVYPTSSNGPWHELRLFRELTRWPLAASDEAPELALPLQSRVDHWRLATLQTLGDGFRWLCVSLAISGFGAWTWAAVRAIRRRAGTYLLVIATAVLGSALAVMLIALLVQVVSFPNQSPIALHEGYPLLVLFGVTAWTAAMYPHSRQRCSIGHGNF